MQVALIYDAGLAGQDLVARITKKYGEPIRHASDEVIWKTDDGDKLIADVFTVAEIGREFFFIFAAADEDDITQFLTL